MSTGNGTVEKVQALSATQRAMLHVLSDGLPHRRAELHACLPDELARQQAVNVHLTRIRKYLLPHGQTIICELVNRSISYRHVRLLNID